MSYRFSLHAVTVASLLLLVCALAHSRPQGKAATAKTLRCTFTLNTTSTWNKDGSPEGIVKPSGLVLRYEAINTDEGSAELKNGSVATGITLQVAAGNLHFIQSFRSGALYVTTVFDREIDGGKLRAVHSRHESYRIPLDGATSSPEQYLGECEIVN
jgi:hypothetical protein